MGAGAVGMDVRMLVAAWPEEAPRGAVTRFCAEHGVSRSWFYEQRARLRVEGLAGLQRRRPARRPANQVAVEVEELAVRVRKELAEDGCDVGPISVRERLLELGVAAPSRATLARILARRGLVAPQPQKRPRSSYRRFEAAAVHQRWQMDSFDWPLADGGPAVVLQTLDDRSRVVASMAAAGETSRAAIAAFDQMARDFQVPCELLTDNGSAFNQSRRGFTCALTAHIHALGVKATTGRPGHPQTQGKDERVHATCQRWLTARPRAQSLAELQTQLDAFDGYYNFCRGHQALGLDPATGRLRTPAQALDAGPVAVAPQPPAAEPLIATPPPRLEPRVVVVRPGGKIAVAHKIIQVGFERIGQTLHVVTDGATVHIFDQTGQPIATVTTSPERRYYGNGKPRGGNQQTHRTSPSLETATLSAPA